MKVTGKGHIVTISGISNFSYPAPVSHVFVKRFHDKIRKIGGSWRALRQSVFITAQMSQKCAYRIRYSLTGKSMLIDADIRNTVKKILYIQFQHQFLCLVRESVAAKRDSFLIGAGIAGYRKFP